MVASLSKNIFLLYYALQVMKFIRYVGSLNSRIYTAVIKYYKFSSLISCSLMSCDMLIK